MATQFVGRAHRLPILLASGALALQYKDEKEHEHQIKIEM
jgi:hypothetical protein